MGNPAGRIGDTGSEHDGYHPSDIIEGSSNVFINGKPAARVGDALEEHTRPGSPPHGRKMAAGANQVFINGKAAVRVGDAIHCGGTLITGSGDVFIGDDPIFTEPSDASLPDIVFPTQHGKMPSGYQTQSHDLTNLKIGYGSPIAPTQPQTGESLPTNPKDPIIKDLIIRLDMYAENAFDNDDQFILTSRDGSYEQSKTIKDDLIPGDAYIDLLYTGLDISKLYTLTQRFSDSRPDQIHFINRSYNALFGLS